MNDSSPYAGVTSLILRRWAVVVAATVTGMALGYLISSTLPERYAATSTVLTVQDPEGVEVPDEDRVSKEQLALTFADIGRRPAVLEPAAEELGMADGWRSLRAAVTIRLVPRTLLLEIETTGASPEIAERRADAVAKWLIEISSGLSPFVQVQTEPGLADNTPVAPNPPMNAIIAGGLGFLVSSALLLASETLQRRRTMRLASIAPVAARVPRRMGTPRQMAQAVLNADPATTEWLDAIAPAFIHLRAAQRAGAGARVAVLGFQDSPLRPVVSTSLAIALALDGSETGLVDLDFRSPSLHTVCGSASAPGVSEMMKSRTARPTFMTTALPGLRVLPNGNKAVPNATLLAPRAIERTIAGATDAGGTLVFDVPVRHTIAEFALVSEKVGTILLVVDEALLGREELGFLTGLHSAGIPVSGLIVIDRPAFSRRLRAGLRRLARLPRPKPSASGGNDRGLAVIETATADDVGDVDELLDDDVEVADVVVAEGRRKPTAPNRTNRQGRNPRA